ncbi:hypothetical protein ACLMJK_004943 [Lecanora helva]
MDPQYGLASKDDLWRLQNEMKNVYATQAEHADRLMRLEHRQDGESRLKSVWGNQSPYPSGFNGTPQQDPGYNPAAEAFKNFDADQPNLMGSLHLDTDDEPRRGASRANSVRFDESALHGHFGTGSRSSTEFLPMRTGSAFGSHPMTERSSSHKSEGRQSSTHSARASSFGLESRPLSATVPPFVPLGPPPGLFLLGPVPSIIRCWLATEFSNSSLLYAAVCTGSYKSTLDIDLITRLGYQDQITKNRDGQRTIKLPVYLPEATIQTASSRSSSPAPTLPTLTTTFTVQDSSCNGDAIQIYLGCDLLRARNADIHFSLDRLTLFDDERNKLSVPLVRPENAALFQNLQTLTATDVSSDVSIGDVQGRNDNNAKLNGESKGPDREFLPAKSRDSVEEPKLQTSADAPSAQGTSSPSVIGEGRRNAPESGRYEPPIPTKSNNDLKDPENLTNGTTPDTPTKTESSNIWGSWRRDPTQAGRGDTSASSGTSTSGYQRAGRGRGMKVLRPSRLTTARSSSAQQPVGFDAAPSRFGENGKSGTSEENQSPASASDRRSFSSDANKATVQSLTSKPRSSNPIGGASAFGWLNSNQKQSSSGTE